MKIVLSGFTAICGGGAIRVPDVPGGQWVPITHVESPEPPPPPVRKTYGRRRPKKGRRK